MDKMNFKKDNVSPLQMKARENNVLKILNALAESPKKMPNEERPEPMVEPMGEPMAKPMGAPMSATAQPMGISPQVMEAQSYDEQGEFVPPPVEGYWLKELEKIDPQNPFIPIAKQAAARLNMLEEELRSRQGAG